MSGWASLSGYLFLKPGGGGLNILKTRKKLWCVLEESQGKLLYFKTEDDARNKPPLGFVELKGAAITLDIDTQNQFVIIVEGREIQLTAENHESMMIWMMALQARRDQFALADNVCKDNAVSLDPHFADGVGSRERSASDLSALKDYQPRQSQQETPRRPTHRALEATRSLHVPSPPGSPNYKTLPSDRKRNHLQRMGVTFDGAHPSLKNIPLSMLQAGRKQQSVSMEMTDVLHLVEQQQNVHNNINNNNNNSIGLLPSKSPVVNGSFLMWSSSSPSTDNNDDHCLDMAKHRALARSASARMGDDGKRHVTSLNISDSSINVKDTQSGERLSSLEQELIATKCELAKAMNRQTCFQEILKQKDDIIEDLDVKLCSKAPVTEGYDSKKRPSSSNRDNQERVRILQNQNRFLNEEVRRLAKLRFHEHGVIRGQTFNILSLEANIEVWKLEYVSLIQSSIRFTGTDTMDDAELSLFGGDRHKDRIVSLLEDARKLNPSLPTYEYLATGEVHVDSFGFKHQFNDEGLLLHYLCQELSQHYLSQANSYEKHQKHWSLYLKNNAKNVMTDRKELKDLVRGGIPEPYRKLMWKAFVLHQVDEIIKDKGAHYYRSLCNAVPDSPLAARYRKQISLDLMRTMPSNVKFSTPGSKGIMDLQDVLLAFCLHNPTVGYCQGMNFLVAMALLFLDAQDAFWTLVAVTEKYHSPSYFDHNLLGAQADQSVLHDLMREKLPGLTKHLDSIEIEISTVTLNWFLALFFDAVPFQTLLRIWDCFLLEGPKVLFRFSLAILQLHSKEIMKKTDTISVMRHLKACARISYDSDGLVQVAFKTLKPFPRRQDIFSKQTFYLNALKEKYRQREMQRVAFLEMENGDAAHELGSCPNAFECGTASSPGQAWVAYGDDTSGSKVCVVNCKQQTMTDTEIRLDTRILAMICVPDDCILLGTLSCFVYACCQDSREVRWQQRVHDAVLALKLYQEDEGGHRQGDEESTNRLFAGLADGTVAVFETVTLSCKVYDIIYIPIGQSPVTCLQVIGNQLWCACGNSISIIHASTLDPMDRFCVSINPYDTVLSLVPGLPGVWISVRGSSVLELWDPLTLSCKLLYDVKLGKSPSVRKEDETYINSSRITSVLALDYSVWIGTGEGILMTFDVFTRSKTDTESPSFMTDGMVSVDSQSLSQAASSTDRGCKRALTVDQENYARLKEVERRVKDLYLQRLVGDGYLRKKSTKDANASMDEEDDTETEETKCLIIEREERETRKRRRKLGTRNSVGDGDANAEQRLPHDRKRNSAGEKTLIDKVREGIDAKIHREAKHKTTTTSNMSKGVKGHTSLPRPKSLSKADKLINVVAGKAGLFSRSGSINDSESAKPTDNCVPNSSDLVEDIDASVSQAHHSSKNSSTSSYHVLDKTLCEVDVSDSSGDGERKQAPEPTHQSPATRPSPSSPPPLPPSHPTVYYLFQEDSKDDNSKTGSPTISKVEGTADDRISSKAPGKETNIVSISQRSAKKSIDSGVSSIAEKSADSSDLYCDNNRVGKNEGTPGLERKQSLEQRENLEQSKPNEERQPTSRSSSKITKQSLASESSLECAVNVSSRFYAGGKRREDEGEKGGDSGHKTSQTASSFDSKSRSLSLDSNKSNDYDDVFSDAVVCPDTKTKSIAATVDKHNDRVESTQELTVKIAGDHVGPANDDMSLTNGYISDMPSTNPKHKKEEGENENDGVEVNDKYDGDDNKKDKFSKNLKSQTPLKELFPGLKKTKKGSDSEIIPTQNGDVTCYPVTDNLPYHISGDCNMNGNADLNSKHGIMEDGANTKDSGSHKVNKDNKCENVSSQPLCEKYKDTAEELSRESTKGSSPVQGNALSPRVSNGKHSSSSSSEEESFGDFVGKPVDKADVPNPDSTKIDTSVVHDTIPQTDADSSPDLYIEEDKDDKSDDMNVSSDDVSSIDDSPSPTEKESPDNDRVRRRSSLPSVKELRAKFETHCHASSLCTSPVVNHSWRKTKEDQVTLPHHANGDTTEPSQTDRGQMKNTQRRLCRLSSSGHSDVLAHESCSSVSSAMERLPESPKEVTSPKDVTAPSPAISGTTKRSDGKRKLEKQFSYDDESAGDAVDTKFYGESDEDLSVHEARVKSFKDSYAAASQRRISLNTPGKFQNKGDASSEIDHNNRGQAQPVHRTLRQYDDFSPVVKPSMIKDEGIQDETIIQKDEQSSSVDSFSSLSSLSRKTSPARHNSEQSSVCNNILPRDADAQYRLDYTNVHVETDMDSVATSAEDQSVTDSLPPSRRLSDLSSTTDMRNQRMHEFLRDTATSLNAQFGDIEDDAAASFLPTPTLSGCNSACWSSYDEISTPSHCGADGVKSFRPDSKFPRSSTQSVISRGTSVASTIDILYHADLSLLSKNKVSDKPVTWLLNTELAGNPVVISLAGAHSDDEAVLIWTREMNETLWTNCPAYEYNPKTKTSRLPSYMRQHLSSTSSSRSSPRQRIPSVNSN